MINELKSQVSSLEKKLEEKNILKETEGKG